MTGVIGVGSGGTEPSQVQSVTGNPSYREPRSGLGTLIPGVQARGVGLTLPQVRLAPGVGGVRQSGGVQLLVT